MSIAPKHAVAEARTGRSAAARQLGVGRRAVAPSPCVVCCVALLSCVGAYAGLRSDDLGDDLRGRPALHVAPPDDVPPNYALPNYALPNYASPKGVPSDDVSSIYRQYTRKRQRSLETPDTVTDSVDADSVDADSVDADSVE